MAVAPTIRIQANKASAIPATPLPTAPPTRTFPTDIVPSPAATALPQTADETARATREALLIVEINNVRAANQLPPYQASAELSAAARAHSCDLAANHMISHTSSDGRTLTERLANGTTTWEWPSESIAAGTDDPSAVVAMWMDEPPEGWHRRNILDEQQREIGVGYCFTADDPSGNQHYWTADFSRRSEQAP